ncbi:hypothetical protein FLL86_17790 [Vibrio cholerae]|nr:hypothetical protein FLL86_17790 [Vibrio cholerae]
MQMRIFYTVLILLYSGIAAAAFSADNSMVEANIYSVDFNTTNQRSVVKVSLFDENNRPVYAGDCSDVIIERKAGENPNIGRLDTNVYVANEAHNNNSCYTYFYPGSSADGNIPGDVIVTAKVNGELLSGDKSEITLTVVGDGSGNGDGICELGESGVADCDGLCVRPAEANGIDCVTGKELTSISVEPNPVSVVKTLTDNLVATGTFDGGATKNITGLLIWSSENSSYVEVLSPALGELDGHLESAQVQGNEIGGPITVTAMAEDISGSPIEGMSAVTVTGPNLVPGSEYVTATPSAIPLGYTSQLKFCVTTQELGELCSTDNDEEGGGDESFITWSTLPASDGLVIDAEGLLTTKGEAADLINKVVTVTATGVVGTAVEGISASAEVNILPPEVDPGASTVTLSAYDVEADNNVQATMHFSFNGGADSLDTASSEYVTWSVTQSKGVSISSEGVIYTGSVEVGDTTVTVTGQGKEGTAFEGENNTAELTIRKVDVPELNIVASDPSASEPNDNGMFTITASKAFAQDTTVNIVISGTANNGTDYRNILEAQKFPAGTQSLNIPVTVINDAVEESSETVVVTLQDGNGYSVQAPYSATVTINDDDQLRVVPMTVEVRCEANAGSAKLWTRVSNNSGKTGYIREPHKGWIEIPSGTNNKEIDYQQTSEYKKELVERFRDSAGGISNSFSLPYDESRCHWEWGHDANGTWTHSYNGYSKIVN